MKVSRESRIYKFANLTAVMPIETGGSLLSHFFISLFACCLFAFVALAASFACGAGAIALLDHFAKLNYSTTAKPYEIFITGFFCSFLIWMIFTNFLKAIKGLSERIDIE